MMEHIINFNPNDVASDSNGIFGLPFTQDNAALVILPIPWEVTVSYRLGTSRASEKIAEASKQIDLYDADAVDMWKKGYFMQDINTEILNKNDYLRHCAELIISNLMEGGSTNEHKQLCNKLEDINEAGAWLRDTIKATTLALLKQGKHVALLGGDHSTPLGFFQAVGEHFGDFGILQIDAHADLRAAFEGFTYSHASIMYNALQQVPQLKKLVQVGIRDYCDEEILFINQNPNRITTYFDHEIKRRQYNGDTWKNICDDIVNQLPTNVYISFDIDGLDPKLCPNTGTPVPGGFETEQIYYLFNRILESGKKIIAFDLNEVSTGDNKQANIDALVGARVLYKMCNLMMRSYNS
ncbi:MAG: agmatinase family protein [Chitinophagaceae bacterium]|jgi:agmatinase|nr:agmatinase family protein [Chitinophagaceae bacterium]